MKPNQTTNPNTANQNTDNQNTENQSIDNPCSENPVKTAAPKKPLPKSLRTIGICIGLVCLIAGGLTAYFFSRPIEAEGKQSLCTYQLSADAGYRVHLHPNALYKEEWLPENQVYSEKLCDFVEISYHSQFTGTNAIDFTGEYQITAILEGYNFHPDYWP